MATNINSSALDFEQIKSKLKVYLSQQSEFSDYNFEASGLSNLLDVLAYNTHLNGLVANISLNEAFLNTAQLRSSVVSHAEALGYRPRSRLSSTAVLGVYLDLSGVSGRPSTIELPEGFSFTGINEQGQYTFRTRTSYIATDDGNGIYTFLDEDGEAKVIAYQGTQRTKTFIVDDTTEVEKVYIIPDETVDIYSVKVDVYESTTSTKYERYTPLEQAITVEAESTYYDIREAPNGYYELNFGDGISFGKKPVAGNKILVTYSSTVAEEANGSNSFSATNDVSVNNVDYTLFFDTQSVSAGGAPKESIESIRKLAPIQFASQQRLVTSLDYKGMILTNFPVVRDVSVWGGEDNVPIDYGKVYISLIYQDNVSEEVKTLTKGQIESQFTNNLSVMSITNEFVDPVNTYLELDTQFYYDRANTTKTLSGMESLVRTKILDYFDTNLETFGQSFRRSDLLTELDSLESSIQASRIFSKIQMRFSPAIGFDNQYKIYFPVKLAAPDLDEYIIESSQFRYNNQVCTFRNKLGSTSIELVSGSTVIFSNIGQYDTFTGVVTLETFNPQSIYGGLSQLKVSATPEDQSYIKPLRNYVLNLDSDKLKVKAIYDEQKTKIVL